MASSTMIGQFLGTTSWSSSSVTETGSSQWGHGPPKAELAHESAAFFAALVTDLSGATTVALVDGYGPARAGWAGRQRTGRSAWWRRRQASVLQAAEHHWRLPWRAKPCWQTGQVIVTVVRSSRHGGVRASPTFIAVIGSATAFLVASARARCARIR